MLHGNKGEEGETELVVPSHTKPHAHEAGRALRHARTRAREHFAQPTKSDGRIPTLSHPKPSRNIVPAENVGILTPCFVPGTHDDLRLSAGKATLTFDK